MCFMTEMFLKRYATGSLTTHASGNQRPFKHTWQLCEGQNEEDVVFFNIIRIFKECSLKNVH